MLSGLLISCSVMYAFVGRKSNETQINFFSYMLNLYDKNNHVVPKLYTMPGVTVDLYTNYIDLYSLYENDIMEFDSKPMHNQLLMVDISNLCNLAKYYTDETGYDPSTLQEDEVYINKYVYYYLAPFIKDDIISFPRLSDLTGNPLRLRIKGCFANQNPNNHVIPFNTFIIMANSELMNSLQAQTGAYNSVAFGNTENSDSFYHQLLELGFESFDLSWNGSIGAEYIYELSSGEIGIIIFGLCFSFICIFSSMKLKSQHEKEDYRKIRAVGLSPFFVPLIPLFESIMIGVPAFVLSYIFSVIGFPLLITHQSKTYSFFVTFTAYETGYKPEMLLYSSALFFGVLAVSLILILLYSALKSEYVYKSFVRKSSEFYLRGKLFSLQYNLLNMKRNKGYIVFLVFLFFFPLFIIGLYSTSSLNSSIYINGLYSEADYLIYSLAILKNSNDMEILRENLEESEFFDEVHLINYSGSLYWCKSENEDAESEKVQFVELNEYTLKETEHLVAAGDLNDVLKDSDMVAVIDNSFKNGTGKYALGENITIISETPQIRVIGAILTNYPLNYNTPSDYSNNPELYIYIPEFYMNMDSISSLEDKSTHQQKLYLYLDDSLSDENYIEIDNRIHKAIYNPHIQVVNQREEQILFKHFNITTMRIAGTMSVLICVISVFALFLLHSQKMINRKNEFIILNKLGYEKDRIKKLNYLYIAVTAIIGISVFFLGYGLYIANIIREIEKRNLYQYSNFTISYMEFPVIILCMIFILIFAVKSSIRNIKD